MFTSSSSKTVKALATRRENDSFERSSRVDSDADTSCDATTGQRSARGFGAREIAAFSSPTLVALADAGAVESLIAFAVTTAFQVARTDRAAITAECTRDDAEFTGTRLTGESRDRRRRHGGDVARHAAVIER